jgi:hypothetical protein
MKHNVCCQKKQKANPLLSWVWWLTILRYPSVYFRIRGSVSTSVYQCQFYPQYRKIVNHQTQLSNGLAFCFFWQHTLCFIGHLHMSRLLKKQKANPLLSWVWWLTILRYPSVYFRIRGSVSTWPSSHVTLTVFRYVWLQDLLYFESPEARPNWNWAHVKMANETQRVLSEKAKGQSITELGLVVDDLKIPSNAILRLIWCMPPLAILGVELALVNTSRHRASDQCQFYPQYRQGRHTPNKSKDCIAGRLNWRIAYFSLGDQQCNPSTYLVYASLGDTGGRIGIGKH